MQTSGALRATLACLGLALVLAGPVFHATAEPALVEAASILDPAAAYPEGPLHWQGAWHYAEMGADRISRLSADGQKQTFFEQPGCGPTAIAPYRDGLIVLCHFSGSLVAVDITGRETARFRATPGGRRLRNPNDASADGQGGVFFSDPGAFSRDIPAEGSIMYLDPRGVLKVAASGLWYPNGVHVDAAAGQLYVSEHLAGKVWRYPIRAGGGLEPAVLVADLRTSLKRSRYAEAGPDGLEIGPDGRLYAALYGEGKVVAIDLSATRAPMQTIEVPIEYVSNLAFAPDGEGVALGPLDNLNPPFPGLVVALPKTASSLGPPR
jgi:sugar lactone lactonase YvrE